MIKLVPAKCPSCGANLELDDNLKRTECEFCKTTIVVDEAIQKYQVELTGKVKVSGIQDEDDKLNIANKYLTSNEIDQALKICHDLLKQNPFNYEAINIILENVIPKIDNGLGYSFFYCQYHGIDMSNMLFVSNRKDLQKYLDMINRLKSNNCSISKEKLMYYEDVCSKLNNRFEKKEKLIHLINKYINKSSKKTLKIIKLFDLEYSKGPDDLPISKNDYEHMVLKDIIDTGFKFYDHSFRFRDVKNVQIEEMLEKMEKFLTEDTSDTKSFFDKFFKR